VTLRFWRVTISLTALAVRSDQLVLDFLVVKALFQPGIRNFFF